MACPGGVGWLGYLTACGVVAPYLNADLVKVQEIVPSASVHGGGDGVVNPVFRDQHNFSLGRIITEGSVNMEVFGGTGNYATAFGNMLDRAIGASVADMTDVCTGFDASCKLIFSPAGGSEIVLPDPAAAQGKALVSSLDLRGNPGGNVQAAFRITSAGADYNLSTTNAPVAADLAFETAGTTDDNNPIPYYASSFTLTGSGETDITDRITDWNITINNNTNPLYTFNGEAFPQDILLGMREVSGNFSYYSSNGEFVETLTHGAVATVTFGSITLNMPFVAFGRSPTPSGGPNEIITRNVEFRAFAASASLPSIYQS